MILAWAHVMSARIQVIRVPLAVLLRTVTLRAEALRTVSLRAVALRAQTIPRWWLQRGLHSHVFIRWSAGLLGDLIGRLGWGTYRACLLAEVQTCGVVARPMFMLVPAQRRTRRAITLRIDIL